MRAKATEVGSARASGARGSELSFSVDVTFCELLSEQASSPPLPPRPAATVPAPRCSPWR